MRIGYAKLGRSMPLTLDKCGSVGGDNECISVVKELALRHPQHEFVLIGRNSGEAPTDVGLPTNVSNPWNTGWADAFRAWKKQVIGSGSFSTLEKHMQLKAWYDENTLETLRNLDGFVLWVGQHGGSNTPLPQVDNPVMMTQPMDSFGLYVSFILQGVNAWRDVDPENREEIYINADPRNYPKMRDLKWPWRHPILAQFNSDHTIKHERYGELAVPDAWKKDVKKVENTYWQSAYKQTYSRLEVCGILPGTPVGDMLSFNPNWEGRERFGLLINEARAYVKPEKTRKYIVKNYVLPLNPTWMHGVWSEDSLKELGVDIQPARFERFTDLYHSVHSTFTTPSSGSGWCTTKVWEGFACGTVCFMHKDYDSQGHALADADEELRTYLRVQSPQQLAQRVEEMHTDKEKWTRIVTKQRAHFEHAVRERRYLRMIEARLSTLAPPVLEHYDPAQYE